MLQLLADPAAAAAWLKERVRGTLCSDSRRVRPGDAFIAWPGHAGDGRRHVAAALAAGAAACLVENAGAEVYGFDDQRIASLAGLKATAGCIAASHFGHPGRALQVVASTGTNGKTSTAWWTAQALTRLGRRCGVVGTLGFGEPPLNGPAGAAAALQSTGLTTPEPLTLHAALRTFVDQGFAACAIEASSIGIVEQRLDGLEIAVVLFTNFTRDHLDYHGSMAAYWAAKRRLFDWPGLRAAVINIDDSQGAALAEELRQRGGLDVITVSLTVPARLQAHGLRYDNHGLTFEVGETAADAGASEIAGAIASPDATAPGPLRHAVRSGLVGEFNASNLMVVLGGLRALGVPLAEAAAVVPWLTPVPGRLQPVAGRDVSVIVDYAHTPDALAKALQALRPLASARGGRLWCVFGCGGNRDTSKRPLMGAIAAAGADRVVLTSDNPRDESPMAILEQVAAGIDKSSGERDAVDIIENRRAAIAYAVRSASTGDVVLLAGKGHEDYQEVAGVRWPFSDLAEAEDALLRRAAAAP